MPFPNLIRCPFCGSDEAHIRCKTERIGDEEHTSTAVVCGFCGASGPPSFRSDYSVAGHQACEDWNKSGDS